MAITRPRGEQIRFTSANTGDHVLDVYMEASEKGGRTLPDLLDDLFDSNGSFKRGSGFYDFVGDYAGSTPYTTGDTMREPVTNDLFVALRDFTSSGSTATDVSNGDLQKVLEITITPTIQSGDASKSVVVKSDESGYEIAYPTLADGSIATAKYANGSITTIKLANGAITSSKIDGTDAANIRSTLGLGTAAVESDTRYAHRANDLSDLASAPTARTNLGLGTAATESDTRYVHRSNNLSDIANASTARTNLGLAINTDVQGYDADTLKADVSDALAAGYGTVGSTLLDGASVALDLTAANAFSLSTTQNFTLSNPTEVTDSTKGVWFLDVTADASGPYTITLDTEYTLQDGSLTVEASATIRLWIVQRAAGSYDVIAEALS